MVARARNGWDGLSQLQDNVRLFVMHKLKRVVWVHKCLGDLEQFKDVNFTDECTVQLERHRRKFFSKTNVPRKLKYHHKHPSKVKVWAEISKWGTTKLIMFSGIMTATKCRDTLSVSLVPFLQKTYSNGHRLYQDNDPKHTSRHIQAFFAQNGINQQASCPERFIERTWLNQWLHCNTMATFGSFPWSADGK